MLSEHIHQGKHLDNYYILAEISSGPTSSVFLAEHPHYTQNSLALKLFHRKLVTKQQRELFLQEVHLLKKIERTHILPILDAGIFEDMPYYITDYIAKGSLRNLLDSQSSQLLPIQEALTIIHMVGQALQYTHQMNIFHGNLKPENILLRNTGDVLLTDFSFVSLQDTFNTEHDHNRSSLPYMAPEQFLGRMKKESDQYALGCIAYELLTGAVPFIAAGYAGFKEKHLAEKAIAPTQHNLLLPISCEEAILKALQKKSADRYPAIKDFVTALCSSTSFQPHGAMTPRSPAPTATTTPPLLVASKKIAETQRFEELQEEQKGSDIPHMLEVAILTLPTEQSNLKQENHANAPANEQSSNPQESRASQPGGINIQQQASTVSLLMEPESAFLAETTTKVVKNVAPLDRNNLVRNTPPENRRAARPIWVIASGLLVVLFVITSSLLFFTLRTTHSQKSSPTAISHKNTHTVPLTPTPVLTPTAEITPTPTRAPASKGAPIAIPSPSATPSPTPTSGLDVTPSSFQLNQDCFKQRTQFDCTANLHLPDTYQDNLAWSASGSSANITFYPPNGTLSPGQDQQVYIYIPRVCSLSGTLSFSTINGMITIPWSC